MVGWEIVYACVPAKNDCKEGWGLRSETICQCALVRRIEAHRPRHFCWFDWTVLCGEFRSHESGKVNSEDWGNTKKPRLCLGGRLCVGIRIQLCSQPPSRGKGEEEIQAKAEAKTLHVRAIVGGKCGESSGFSQGLRASILPLCDDLFVLVQSAINR